MLGQLNAQARCLPDMTLKQLSHHPTHEIQLVLSVGSDMDSRGKYDHQSQGPRTARALVCCQHLKHMKPS
jgi:hypothetical protein